MRKVQDPQLFSYLGGGEEVQQRYDDGHLVHDDCIILLPAPVRDTHQHIIIYHMSL